MESLELPTDEGEDGEGLAAQDKKMQSLRQRCKNTLHMAACMYSAGTKHKQHEESFARLALHSGQHTARK